jgi:hypothetical protein
VATTIKKSATVFVCAFELQRVEVPSFEPDSEEIAGDVDLSAFPVLQLTLSLPRSRHEL